MKRVLFFVMTLAAGSLPAADDKSTGPQTAVYRVTGLFDHGREADLKTTLEQISEVQLMSVDFEHAEATFQYDAVKAFPGTKPGDVQKRFDEKLRTASRNTFGIKPLIATPHEKLTRIDIPVVGLDCRACSLAAYEAVAGLEGVAQATASFHDGLVSALIDPAVTDRAKLEQALKAKRVELKQP